LIAKTTTADRSAATAAAAMELRSLISHCSRPIPQADYGQQSHKLTMADPASLTMADPASIMWLTQFLRGVEILFFFFSLTAASIDHRQKEPIDSS